MVAITREFLEKTAQNVEDQQVETRVSAHRLEGAKSLLDQLLEEWDKPAPDDEEEPLDTQ